MKPPIVQANYEVLEEVAGLFTRCHDKTDQLTQRLHSTARRLYDTGWEGKGSEAFFADMEKSVLQRLNRLRYAFEASNKTVLNIMNIMQDAEKQARIALDAGLEGVSLLGMAGAAIGMIGYELGRVNSGVGNDRLRDIRGKSPHFYTQMEILRRYLGGEITSEQAHRQMLAGNKPKFLKTELLFGEKTLWDSEGSMWDAGDQGDNWAWRLDALGYDTHGKVGLTYEDGKLEGKAEGDLSLYLARFQGNVEYNGLSAAIDARAGARLSGEAVGTWDPKAGKGQFKLEGEAFAGVEARVSTQFKSEYVTVDLTGSAAYGVGVRGVFEVNYDNGKFTTDAGFLAALKPGVGAQTKITVDVGKMGRDGLKAFDDWRKTIRF